MTNCTQSEKKKNLRKATGSGKARRWTVLTRTALGIGLSVGMVATPKFARAQYAGHVSSYVVDVNSGAVLSQVDPDLQRYPASLTKLMTLYMAFRALRAGDITPDTTVPVSIHASIQAPSKLGLVPGTRFTVQQAILGLVTKSANDAACALGELIGGGDEVRFANMMTQQARALGMSNTTFRNASGLPDPDQVTTARDLSMLAQHLVQDFPEYYHYFSTPMFAFHGRMIPNHNPMLKTYAGADGMKTGYTDLAGHNLITSAMRSNVRLVGVVLGARSNPQRNSMMASILDQGFAAEGVAPMAPLHPPVVLARNTRRHGRVAGGSSAVFEVAEAPTGPRRYQPVGHGVKHHSVASAKLRMATSRHVVSTKKTSRHQKG
ncbi:D-alanyl-D-alanine serine-type carboxypeptidase [Asaia krungthepensis NRIC 0535]|uniref:D-alanyl-D-alanine serine-type carboxypeptidase n=2 Tax=Asaia krungthepensis TaxID=220990 RepID=A0ABQ0Q6C0_9PROT|nr:D-alanyl-D-alanine serine-type carboxypeptidase [Asaia krungthepensis NRIC 0535]